MKDGVRDLVYFAPISFIDNTETVSLDLDSRKELLKRGKIQAGKP